MSKANDTAILQLVKRGFFCHEIAAATGYALRTITNVLRRNGVTDGRTLRRGKRGRVAARNGNVAARQDAIYELLSREPGLTYVQVANVLGIGRQYVRNALAGMDRRKLLLYEGDNGELYPYREDE